MSRFADYLDADYLPGAVRRSFYGEASPFSILNYELLKKVKFKPESNIAGKFMNEFSALSSNPNFLVESSMKLPSDFTRMAGYL